MSKKEEQKEISKENKKEVSKKEKNVKTDKKKETKKKEKKESLFVQIKKEMSKVHFPSRKDMVKYSIATIVFIIFFAVYFYAIELVTAFLKSLVL